MKRIIVGESGGPTPVIDAAVAGVLDRSRRAGVEVWGMLNGLEGLLYANIDGNVVDLSRIDPYSFLFNGPGAGLGTTRIKPKPDQYQRMSRHLELMGVDGVVYIGGNDSADQLRGLTEISGIKGIHAIKTVDNDLPETHHCPGFGSAALYNATALKNVCNDFLSYRVWNNFRRGGEVKPGLSVAPVVIYQVMGRSAGWLAQAAAFAKVDPRGELVPDNPPHMILSKEIPFERDRFLTELEKVLSRLGNAVIVVQEDLTDKAGGQDLARLHSRDTVADAHGNIQYGRATSFSTAIFLAQLVRSELKVKAVPGKVKEVVLNPQHVQRSFMASPVDASESFQVGWSAAEALLSGLTGKSVVLERKDGRTKTGLASLDKIAARARVVPPEFIDGWNGPSQKFIDEFIYLIGGPLGIPHYLSRRFPAVAAPEWIKNHPYTQD